MEEVKKEEKKKLFQAFKAKDIVFLAIISAVMLLTSSIMPLVAHVPVFGVIQVCLGIQFSLFPAIGLMKVRKPGALLFVSVFSGIVLIFMNTIMFACLAFCAILCEALVLLFFRGYAKDGACFLGAALYLPMSLPFLYVWYQIIGGEDTVATYANSNPLLSVGMSAAVIAVCFLGAFLGVRISRELRRAGALKK